MSGCRIGVHKAGVATQIIQHAWQPFALQVGLASIDATPADGNPPGL